MEGLLDIAMMWVGYAVSGVLAVFFLLIAASLLWIHLSIAVSSWWIRLKVEAKYPEINCVKADFKQSRFWKAKLLWFFLTNVKYSISTNGCTQNCTREGKGFTADFTGWIPKTRLAQPQERPIEVS